MPALKDRPERPEPNRRGQSYSTEQAHSYHSMTIDELLDERNYFKSEELDTSEIDEVLKAKTSFYR